MAQCSLCKKPVMWARTGEGNKRVPLDLPPVPNGTAWIEDGVVKYSSAERPKPEGVRSYRPHFVSCEPYKAKKRIERLLRS